MRTGKSRLVVGGSDRYEKGGEDAAEKKPLTVQGQRRELRPE